MKKYLLIVMLILGAVTPSYSQMLVLDEAVLAQTVATVSRLTRQIQILLEQLQDMKRNSALSNPEWNTQTALLLRLLGELGRASSVLYTHDGSQEVWEKIYTEDAVDTTGTWLEAERERSHATMMTQRDLLQLVETRRKSFADDVARMETLQEELVSATGRNQILIASGNIQMEQAWRMAKLEELVSMLANSQIVAAASVENEKANREANERAFLRNFDKEPQTVEFTDVGLTDWDVPVYQRGAE